MNTKKLTMNAILLAIGALLHQFTPALGLPMQPDFSLAMLFVIMILNKNDYKTTLASALVTGIFAALTTKFPGGQIPNILDKLITANVMYFIMFIIYKIKFISNLNTKKQDSVIALIILPIGTLISGSVFLASAQFIVGLPAPFMALFVAVVIPATLVNLIGGAILFKIVSLSLKRSCYSL